MQVHVQRGDSAVEVIRSIEQIRGRKKIIFESGFVLWVRKGSNLPFSPDIGSEVEETDLERFILADQYPSALERAVSMLAERARSQKEIEQFNEKDILGLLGHAGSCHNAAFMSG